MGKNLRWKLLVILGVVALSVFAFYPPDKKVRLGLDLKGGVHLVLRVQTDDALRLLTEGTAEQLREALQDGGPGWSDGGRHGRLVVHRDRRSRRAGRGVPERAHHRGAVFDRSSTGPGSYNFQMKPNIIVDNRESTVNQALQTIERRVNELGVAEPIVARHSAADQILVQLPGVTDVNRAKEIIRSTALLELRLVEQGPFPDEAAAAQAYGGNIPPDIQVLPGRSEVAAAGQPAGAVYYALRRVPAVTGRDLRSATPQMDEYNRPAVGFNFNTEGAQKFGAFTGANIGRQLAVVLDGRVQTAPRIESRIDYDGRITGTFSAQEAADLALTLRSGALPASLTYLEERTVGPSLGAASVRAGVIAAVGGLFLVMIFMVSYYKLVRLQRADLDHHQPDHPARPDVLPGRDHDAAGYRRVHSDHRHGRRLERPDLRAHQGRTRARPRASSRRWRPGSTVCSSPFSTPTSRR